MGAGVEAGTDSCREEAKAFLEETRATNGGKSILDLGLAERLYSMWKGIQDKRGILGSALKQDDIAFDEVDFLEKYPQLRVRAFSLDEIRTNYEFVNGVIASLENEYSEKIKPLLNQPTTVFEKGSEGFRNKIHNLMRDQKFGEALGSLLFFEGGFGECMKFEEYLGVTCKRFYSRDEFVRLLSEIQSGKQGAEIEKSSLLRDMLRHIPSMLLRANPFVRSEREVSPDGSKGLTLTLPVKPGKEMRSNEWRLFYQKLKRANEEFWKGEIWGPSLGTIKIRLTLEQHGREDPQAVAVHLLQGDISHSSMGGGYVTFDRKEFRDLLGLTNISPQEGLTLAHEVGHVLGFDDHYYSYFDMDSCESGWNDLPTDIMTCPDQPHISERDLMLIYRAYGKVPSENDNVILDSIQ